MEQLIKYLAEFGLTALSITALIGYLGRKVFEHYLSLKIDTFKNELDKKTIEFKTELERINYEHQIKFSKLHSERVEIIKDIFKQITILENLVKAVTTTWQGPEWIETQTREDNASDQLKKTRILFEESKIYFAKDLSNEIDNTLQICETYIIESLRIKSQAKRETFNKDFFIEMEKNEQSSYRKWLSLESESHLELEKIRESLADRFRELFGVI